MEGFHLLHVLLLGVAISSLPNLVSTSTPLIQCNFDSPDACGMNRHSGWHFSSNGTDDPMAIYSNDTKGDYAYISADDDITGRSWMKWTHMPKGKYCLSFDAFAFGDRDGYIGAYINRFVDTNGADSFRGFMYHRVSTSWKREYGSIHATNTFNMTLFGLADSERNVGLAIDEIRLDEGFCQKDSPAH